MNEHYQSRSAQILRKVTATQQVAWSPETGWTDQIQADIEHLVDQFSPTSWSVKL